MASIVDRRIASGFLGVALVLSACGSAADPGATPTTENARTTAVPNPGVYGEIESSFTGSGPKVVVLGDSIMVATRKTLRSELDGYAVKVAALSGEGLSGGPLSQALGGGSMPEIAGDYAEADPAVVVIELGTNDAWLEELTVDAAEQALANIVGEFPEACLVAVSVTESAQAEGYDDAEAAKINESLVGVADQLVDWPKLSSEQPGSLKPDGIHPTERGTKVLASAVAEAVDACSR